MDEVQSRPPDPLGFGVDEAADVFALIGAANRLDGLIVTESDLGPECVRLSSRLAGELFQKPVDPEARGSRSP